jgi:hypothetical protein
MNTRYSLARGPEVTRAVLCDQHFGRLDDFEFDGFRVTTQERAPGCACDVCECSREQTAAEINAHTA